MVLSPQLFESPVHGGLGGAVRDVDREVQPGIIIIITTTTTTTINIIMVISHHHHHHHQKL